MAYHKQFHSIRHNYKYDIKEVNYNHGHPLEFDCVKYDQQEVNALNNFEVINDNGNVNYESCYEDSNVIVRQTQFGDIVLKAEVINGHISYRCYYQEVSNDVDEEKDGVQLVVSLLFIIKYNEEYNGRLYRL